MRNYKVIIHRSDEREDHKYIARVPTGNSKHKWRYFYTMPAYKAYLNSKRVSSKTELSKVKKQTKLNGNKTNNILNKLLKSKTNNLLYSKNTIEKGKKAINKLLKSSNIKNTKIIDKGKTFISNILKTTNKKLDKTVKTVDTNISKAIKTVDKKIDKVINKNAIKTGKKYVDKFSSSNTTKKVSGITGDGSLIEKAKNVVSNIVSGFLNTGMKLSMAFYDYAESKTAEEEAPESITKLKKKTGYDTDDEDQAEINPMYHSMQMEWTNNCSYCTAAYDLRQRGYDVEAGMVDDLDGEFTSEILSWYNDPKLVSMEEIKKNQGLGYYNSKETEAKAIENELKSYGDGARGHFLITWEQGGGHDVIWEVENDEVVIRDCQSNETLSIYDYYQYADRVDYFRSDNLEINENILKTVRNKK